MTKKNGAVTIIGEVASDEVAKRMIDMALLGTNFKIDHREILREVIAESPLFSKKDKIQISNTLDELDKHSRVNTGKQKNVKVVIGTNFGDEGKGLMTDYFCSEFNSNEEILNIRFNGGAQAGHTTVKEDGRRHIFHHFGSGSLNENVTTYLSSYFILNPMLFIREYEALKVNKPKVYVHKDCIITFPCDMMINQIVEQHRNDSKHGSCGVGIYETVMRNKNYSKITIGYINDNLADIVNIMTDTVTNYVSKRLSELGVDVDTVTTDEWKLIKNINIMENYADDLKFMLEHIEIVDDSIINNYDNIVFEGAQGLLLDCANEEYYPHLTPSSTGLENVMSILNGIENCDIAVCYVTRSYFTRHGAGKLKTECESTDINEDGLMDKTNEANAFQGKFRYGYFDIDSIKEAIKTDLKFLNREATVELSITHLDETHGVLVSPGGLDIYINEIFEILHIKTGYLSYGEHASNIKTFKR